MTHSFPDVRYGLEESNRASALLGREGQLVAGMSVDLWRAPLDGSGTMKLVTQYHAIDPELKSNQGVVSPDGRWLAFTVGTRSIEKVSAVKAPASFCWT